MIDEPEPFSLHLTFVSRLFDLHHTCSFGENGCHCDEAQQRIESGDILCEKGVTECPDDCPICKRCMEDLGCL